MGLLTAKTRSPFFKIFFDFLIESSENLGLIELDLLLGLQTFVV